MSCSLSNISLVSSTYWFSIKMNTPAIRSSWTIRTKWSSGFFLHFKQGLLSFVTLHPPSPGILTISTPPESHLLKIIHGDSSHLGGQEGHWRLISPLCFQTPCWDLLKWFPGTLWLLKSLLRCRNFIIPLSSPHVKINIFWEGSGILCSSLIPYCEVLDFSIWTYTPFW